MSKRMRRVCMTVTGTLWAIALAGCYEHVVRAEGYGTEGMDVYEPAVGDDETVYGGATKQSLHKSEPQKPVVKPPKSTNWMARPPNPSM